MIMDSHYARAFPRNSFDAEAFRPTVRSYPIQPIELSIPNDPMIGNAGLYNPSLFVNPALMQNMPGMFPVGGAHVPQYGNPTTVHPASLHFGNVMPGQTMGVQPFVGSPVSRPNSGGIQSTSASFSSAPRAPAFSRRTEGNTLGPSRYSSVAVGGSGEPYFCRTPNSTLRQRTAQACEKCRDRKTKCSGERPICKRCSERGMICKWAPETRVRGHSRSKASGQVPAADLPSESIDALSHPIPSLPASSSDEQLASSSSNDASASTGKQTESTSGKGDRAKRGSLSRAMAKKNLAAQRYSWPMGSPSSSLQVGGMLPQTSIPLPVSALDDTWDSVWNRREPPQVDAAPVPGRAFDFESLMNGSFDYSSESSRGSSPPMTASTSGSSLSTLSSSIDSLDGLSAILQSQLPAAEDSDFTAEMYDLLNLPASSSSESSSSGSSPASGIFDGDNMAEFAEFAEAAKANGGDIANEITPMPQMVMGQDDNFMSQYLSSDFYGL